MLLHKNKTVGYYWWIFFIKTCVYRIGFAFQPCGHIGLQK